MPINLKIIGYICYLLMAVTLIFLTLETALWFGYQITDHRYLENMSDFEGLSSIDNYDDHVKIAVFGGSSAAGVNAVRGFSDVLKVQLKSLYPEIDVYIKNYAVQAQPFHKHQAEIAKSIIDKFDIILIYAGHNEAYNYLDEIGYFRPPGQKDAPRLYLYWPATRNSKEFSFSKFLKYNSRILNISDKANRKYVEPRFSKLFSDNLPGSNSDIYNRAPYKVFEPVKAVPDTEKVTIAANFANDLEEIAELAELHGTKVVVSSTPFNLEFIPRFSTHRPGLSAPELIRFNKYYEKGREAYEAGDYGEAIVELLKGEIIDDQVAIVDYLLGRCYLNIGNKQLGIAYLEKSVDHDGITERRLSSLRAIARNKAISHNNLYFVDTVQTFYDLIDQGASDSMLFSDNLHPSFTGHIFISLNFLSQIVEFEPFKNTVSGSRIHNQPLTDFLLLEDNYQEAMGVTKNELRWNAWKIMSWYLVEARKHSDPGPALSLAEEYLDDFKRLSSKNVQEEAGYLLFSAQIEALRGNKQLAVSMLNEALQLSSEHIGFLLKGTITPKGKITPYNVEYQDRFRQLGIEYSDIVHEFQVINGTPGYNPLRDS